MIINFDLKATTSSLACCSQSSGWGFLSHEILLAWCNSEETTSADYSGGKSSYSSIGSKLSTIGSSPKFDARLGVKLSSAWECILH